MELHPDCIRDVLIYLEDNLRFYDDEHGRMVLQPIGWKQISEDETLDQKYLVEDIKYAIFQLHKAGLIVGSKTAGGPGIYSIDVEDITWIGHELLGNIHGEEVWKETKSVAAKIGGVSLKALESIASGVTSAIIQRTLGGQQP